MADPFSYLEEKINGLAKAMGDLAKLNKASFDYLSRGLFLGHSQSRYPVQVGLPEQQIEMLERGGFIGGGEKKPNEISDEMVGYHAEGQVGQAVTGKECEDKTPFGTVYHAAPTSVFSAGYPLSLLFQFGEELINAVKPEKVSDTFINELNSGVVDAIAEAHKYERLSRLQVPTTPAPQPTPRRRPRRRSTSGTPSSYAHGQVDARKNEITVHAEGNVIIDNQSNNRETKDYSSAYIS